MRDSLNLPAPEQRLPSRSLLANLLITGLSLGLLFWAARLLYERFTSVASVDAVINAPVIDITAPQEGVVSELVMNTGEQATAGVALATLTNPRVSELRLQEVRSQLSRQQAELQAAQDRLTQLLAVTARAEVDYRNQERLELSEAQQSVEQVEADLRAAEARLRGAEAQLRLSQTNQRRIAALYAEGAVSQQARDQSTTDRDLAVMEFNQRRAEAESLRERRQQLQANQEAANLGLSLSRTRSNSDPRLRLDELRLQIADIRRTIAVLQEQIQAAQAELSEAETDTNRLKKIDINAPVTGVVWQLAVQPGRTVQQGELLGQLLDCRRRWMDAYVDERTLRSLGPGTTATIQLYGDRSQTLSGRVTLIRSGVGRITAGQDLAVPIAPNLPREAQVRVELEPSETLDSGNFCYVGYTGKVTFDLR